MEVVRITPAAIRLEMEKRIEKEMAVEPNTVGEPPAGYQIDSIRVRPGTVRVSGPESTLTTILSLSTEPVTVSDIDAKKGEKTVEIPIVLSPTSLRLLPGQNKKVSVKIKLKAK